MSNGHYYDRGGNVCVIGAGASGLLATKNLLEHGFGVDCYERDTGVGGLWNWRHDRSPVYANLHLISSKSTTQIPDFPMPDWWPDYPHHRQVLSYLDRYADHFELRPHIWFGTEVVRAQPVPGDPAGRWDVTTRTTGGGTERTHRYAAVVVANGHHWSPAMPEYEGMAEFGGELIHASAFNDPATLRGRRVLVVGAGNTGCDVAVEAAQRAKSCWHSSRRGYHYLPKYLLGRPLDQLHELLRAARLPVRMRQWVIHRALRFSVGDLRRFGLPRPDHRVGETHPIVNSLLVYYLGHGLITPVPEVARFQAESVVLTNGEQIEPDLVVLATGYAPRFDFLDAELLGVDESGRPHLPLNLFGRHPTLAVAGLLQPESGLFGLVHWQTVAVARWLRLRQREPGRAGAVWSQLIGQVDRRLSDARPRSSARHWFQVSRGRYLRTLEGTLKELARS
nr:NAD(P)-binding domain-containing protein [Natronosporangium hydrolyticum]